MDNYCTAENHCHCEEAEGRRGNPLLPISSAPPKTTVIARRPKADVAIPFKFGIRHSPFRHLTDMRQGFSWDVPAGRYMELFYRMLA